MEWILSEAVESGDLRIVDQFGATHWQYYRYNARRYLHEACTRGHLHVVRWLHNVFNLTRGDATSDNNYALRLACDFGHLAVAQWLYRTFQLHGRSNMPYATTQMCTDTKNGLQATQWVYKTYKLPWPTSCAKWTRRTHTAWYFQPHVAAFASRLPAILLMDVLRKL